MLKAINFNRPLLGTKSFGPSQKPMTTTKSRADVSILERIKQLRSSAPLNLEQQVVDAGDSGEMCSECGISMALGDMGYVCEACGKNGGELEISQQTIQITLNNNQATPYMSSEGRSKCRNQDDKFNQTYNSAFARLQRQHSKKNTEFYIPLDILRETAHQYATICHSGQSSVIKIKSDAVTQKEMNSSNSPNLVSESLDLDLDSKPGQQRHNLILSALLQNQLDVHGMSKTDNYICEFNGITKAKLTKSKNRLQTFIKSGAVAHVHPYDRITSFVYLFLSKLGMDTVYTDLVVAIIRRADEQTDMIRYRTCQDNSKVVGAIWLIARQLNIKILHSTISEKCERISKSTYARYVDFIDVNRRRINPILVKHKVRPIPKSFAHIKGHREPSGRTLEPMPEKYRGVFLWTPDPVPIPATPKTPMTTASIANAKLAHGKKSEAKNQPELDSALESVAAKVDAERELVAIDHIIAPSA